jgi:hypothetical protein
MVGLGFSDVLLTTVGLLELALALVLILLCAGLVVVVPGA